MSIEYKFFSPQARQGSSGDFIDQVYEVPEGKKAMVVCLFIAKSTEHAGFYVDAKGKTQNGAEYERVFALKTTTENTESYAKEVKIPLNAGQRFVAEKGTGGFSVLEMPVDSQHKTLKNAVPNFPTTKKTAARKYQQFNDVKLPSAQQIRDVAFGGGVWVALCGSWRGPHTTAQTHSVEIFTSSDGAEWTQRALAENVYAGSIAFGNGVFVVMAKGYYGNNMYQRSEDGGNSWETRTFPDNEAMNGSVVFGNGRFLVTGSSANKVFRSLDGDTWETYTLPSAQNFHHLAHGNEYYIAAGHHYNTRVSTVSKSTDGGKTWTNYTLGESVYIRDIVFANGVFVVKAYYSNPNEKTLYVSADGENWTKQTTSFYLNRVFAANEQFFAFVGAGPKDLYTSVDGENWTKNANPDIAAPGEISALGHAEGRYIALSGGHNSTAYDAVYLSVDGEHFSRDGVANLRDNNLLSAGEALFLTSPDTAFASKDFLGGAAFLVSGAQFVVSARFIGDTYYLLCGMSNKLYRSTDLLTWQVVNLPKVDFWTDIVFDGSDFWLIAENSATIYYSPDLVTWNTKPLGEALLWNSAAVFNGAILLAALGQNFIYRSSDSGDTWQKTVLPHGTAFLGLAGPVIATGSLSSSRGSVSFDGVNWSERALPSSGGIFYTSKGKFFLESSDGTIFTTEDTLRWERVASIDPSHLFLQFTKGRENYVDTYNPENNTFYRTVAS